MAAHITFSNHGEASTVGFDPGQMLLSRAPQYLNVDRVLAIRASGVDRTFIITILNVLECSCPRIFSRRAPGNFRIYPIHVPRPEQVIRVERQIRIADLGGPFQRLYGSDDVQVVVAQALRPEANGVGAVLSRGWSRHQEKRPHEATCGATLAAHGARSCWPER